MPNPPRRSSPPPPQYYTPMWQSPIFLGAVAALILLSIGGGAMYVMVQKRSEEKQYDAAVKDLGESQYAKAIKRFDALLTEFPEGVYVERAMVWRSIAQVRQLCDGSTPAWNEALGAVKELVAQHKQRAFFKERAKDVSDLTAKISAGLAAQAKKNANADDLAKSQEALQLLESTFTGDQRPTDKITETLALMDQARFEIEKATVRRNAIAKMDEAIAERQPIRVFAEHRLLYHRYADLRDDKEVRTRRDKARQLEQALVVFEPASGVEAGRPPEPPRPSWTLERREAAPSAKASGAVFPVQVADVLYGVDSGSGVVVWRMPTGFDPAFSAVGVGEKILLHAPKQDRLALLEASSGKVVWTRPLAGLQLRPNVQPAVLGEAFYLAASKDADAAKGRLAGWSTATGEPIGQFVFPQLLAASAAADAARSTLLVPGEQASLYVVQPGARKCERVLALDHEPDAIRTPPVLAGRFLFLIENLAKNASSLRCLTLSASDGADSQRQIVPLVGWSWRPPVAQGGRLFVTTSGGRFAVFEMGGETDEKPLSDLSRSAETAEASSQQDYPLAPTETDFWTIGASAKRFSIAAQGTQATPAAEIPLDGFASDPPRVLRDTLVVASTNKRTGVVDLRGIHPTTAAVIWNATLGSLADAVRPMADGKTLERLSGGESLAIATSDLGKDQIVDKPFPKPSSASAPRETGPVVWRPVDAWKVGTLLWTNAAAPSSTKGRLLYVAPDGTAKSIPLPAPAVSRPVALGDGVLVPAADGMLYLIDPRTGAELAEPFAAPYADGKPMKLGSLAARDEKSILMHVGGSILKLALARDKVARLREVARLDVGKAPVGELTLVGTVVVVAADRELLLIDPDAPKIDAKFDLGDAVDGELAVVAAAALVRTRGGRLACIEPLGGKLQRRWLVDFPKRPVGAPATFGEAIWLATADGVVQELRLKDGSSGRRWDARRSLSGGPWRIGEQVVVEAADGSLLRLETAGD